MLDADERDVRRHIRTTIDRAGRAVDREPDRVPAPSRTLQKVAGGRQVLELAEQEVARYVADARAEGASWAEIGHQFGNISKQAAYDRFGRPADRPRHRWKGTSNSKPGA